MKGQRKGVISISGNRENDEDVGYHALYCADAVGPLSFLFFSFSFSGLFGSVRFGWADGCNEAG